AYLTASEAASLLDDAGLTGLGVAVCRAGSPDPLVRADRIGALAEQEFGPPLHLLVLPGALHDLEAAALRAFADAPEAVVADLTTR
ncbi:MAG: diphthine synthase, partial [Halobacteriaceae archaeon]